MVEAAWHIDGTGLRADVLIIGDVPTAEAEAAATAASLRIVGCLTCAEGLSALREGHTADLLLVELSDHWSSAEAALLDMIAAQVVPAAILSFPLSVLDPVAAAVSLANVTLLCAPTMAERVAAMGLARLTPSSHLAEESLLGEAARFQMLTSEVARIARTLAALVDDPTAARSSGFQPGVAGSPTPDAAPPIQVSARDIRTTIRLRRQREALFGQELFGDPVWDMLLDLAAARLEKSQVAVSSLCIAAMVPPTTALRWIATLTEAGTIVRVPDPDDRRRVFLEVSDTTAEALLAFLAKAKGAGVALL